MPSRVTLVHIIAVAGLLVVSAGAIASAEDGSSVRSAQPTAALALPEGFAVLHRTPIAASASQVKGLGSFMSDPVLREMGIDWQSIVTAGAQHGFALHVAPARDRLCLISTSPETGSSLACADAARIRDTGLFVRTSVAEGTDTVVVGLVPDGVATVGVDADPPSQVVVEHNTAVMEATPRGDGRLRWSDAQGAHSVAMPPSPLQ